MAFKNKLKKKRVIKFSSIKRKNLVNSTVLFLNDRFSSRLDTVFSSQLNTLRMLKVAFGLGQTKLLKRLNVKNKNNEFYIQNFLSALELRVSNIVYNSGLASSRYLIKQLISKRKVFVNGNKIKSNNFRLSVQDIISFDKSVFSTCKRQVFKKKLMFLQSRYFEVNYNIFVLIVLYKKLDHESSLFLSNKLSKLDFKFLNN